MHKFVEGRIAIQRDLLSSCNNAPGRPINSNPEIFTVTMYRTNIIIIIIIIISFMFAPIHS